MSTYFRRLYLDVLLGGAQLLLLVIGMLTPGPAAWPISLTLIASISLAAWIGLYRRLRVVEDTPTSNIASAAQGYVEFSGRCEHTPDAPTFAPYSHLPCVWCRYLMEVHTDKKWLPCEQGETDASFLLADATGRCAVDPAGAEVVTNEKETWVQGDYRYTEWRILQHHSVYVLGDFRTLAHQPSVADMESDVSALLGEWKRDRPALLARYDRNRDGTIDLDEWEQARLAARAEVEKNYREMQAAPELSVVRAPTDGRKFLISNLSQRELLRMYRRWIGVHLTIFIAAMAGLGWNLIG